MLKGGTPPQPHLSITSGLDSQDVLVLSPMDHAMKRKSSDTDVVMQDSDGELKHSCVGNGVSTHLVESLFEIVGGDGVAQSREQ